MSVCASIVGAACSFPSGPTLPLADAAVRSQLALIRHHPFYVDRCGVRVRAQYFPDPNTGFDVMRWCQLAQAALDELADTLTASATLPHRHCVLWLVLPLADRPGVPDDLAQRLLQTAQGQRWNWSQIHTVRGGHAVGVHALRQAQAAVSKRPDTLAVLLAVDTQLHPETLQWLEDRRLLHGAHDRSAGQSRPNPYGRVPGEGAAAVAVMAANHRAAWASVLGAAIATEAMTHDVPEPCLGLGLTQAAQAAQATTAEASPFGKAGAICHVTADLNGEPYRGDEFGFTALRLSDALAADWQRTIPALASSDLGSASAITHLALEAYKLHHCPVAPTGQHLILSRSDDTLRGAVVLGSTDSLSRAA